MSARTFVRRLEFGHKKKNRPDDPTYIDRFLYGFILFAMAFVAVPIQPLMLRYASPAFIDKWNWFKEAFRDSIGLDTPK